MTDIDFLTQAISLAQQSTEPVKCACLLVKDGKVLAQAYNSQRADNIATYHAEIKAIELANKKLGTRKLSGTTAFCSCEPCVMCLVALSLANVERIVYVQTMKEVAPNDQLAKIDSEVFAQSYLNFVPKLEHLVVS